MKLSTLFSYDEIFVEKKFLNNILAHKKKNGESETLTDHSQKTLDKANEIIDKLKLNDILSNLNYCLYEELNFVPDTHSKLKVTKEKFNDALLELLSTLIYFHDLGKINKKYQKKLGNDNGIEEFNDSYHSSYGHILINQILFSNNTNTKYNKNDKLAFCAILLSTIVNRHHTPLLDMDQPSASKSLCKKNIWAAIEENYNKNIKGIKNACKKTILNELNEKIEKENNDFLLDQQNGILAKIEYKPIESLFFIYKLWYSILVQADSLATEEFDIGEKVSLNFIDEKLGKKLEEDFHKVREYNKNLDKKEETLKKNINQVKNINELRTRILLESLQTLNQSMQNNKVFYLEVPTGGGKTNTSLKLALELVRKKGLVRINYVFPYINIIEQNHSEITETLGKKDTDEIVSKIYNQSDWQLEEQQEEENSTLRNQRFLNYPINVITNVNFFNIFLKSAKKNSIKILELCNSVVILDEIHTLPNKKWHYFAETINKLANFYNIHFIIMSATLPDISCLIAERELQPLKLIINPEEYEKHNLLQRVTYVIEENSDPEKEIEEIFKIYEKISDNPQYKKILIVVNTINNSIELYELIKKYSKDRKVFVLNSTTLAFKRKEIIAILKNSKNEKITLISTQSIEAGVSIDCDVAIRADAPLDSIEQIAGRVNRNSEKPLKTSQVFIVNSSTKKHVYSNDIRADFSINETKKFLLERNFRGYYEKILERLNQQETLIKSNILKLMEPTKKLKFDTLNKEDYIETQSFTIFLPIKIPKNYFSDYVKILESFGLANQEQIDGENVWKIYSQIRNNKEIGEKEFRKILFIVKNFCSNLTLIKNNKYSFSFKEFVEQLVNHKLYSDDSIIKTDASFVKKYYDQNYGLNLIKLKEDYNNLKEITFI